MLRTHPFRTSVTSLGAAAALVVLAGMTNEHKGAGWTDGTQAVANIAWILMLLCVLLAAVALALGLVQIGRQRRSTPAATATANDGQSRS
jgi:uncharacterized membrane protein